MTCFGDETFGPVISLYRFHDEADADRARQRRRVRPQRLDLQPGRRPGARRIARQIKCGTVNINEAFGATFASIDSPMGGMRESGMGRRQGGEGIHRYTESQSVGTQRLIRFAPMLGMSDRDVRQGDDRQPAADEEARPGLMTEFDYDVLVIGSGLRRVGRRAAADREGLPGRRARGRRPVRGRRLPDTSLRPARSYLFAPGARLLRHPADRRGPRLPDRRRRRRRRRVAGLRQHALRAARRRSTATRRGRTSPTGRPSSRPTTTRPSGCSAWSSTPTARRPTR